MCFVTKIAPDLISIFLEIESSITDLPTKVLVNQMSTEDDKNIQRIKYENIYCFLIK